MFLVTEKPTNAKALRWNWGSNRINWRLEELDYSRSRPSPPTVSLWGRVWVIMGLEQCNVVTNLRKLGSWDPCSEFGSETRLVVWPQAGYFNLSDLHFLYLLNWKRKIAIVILIRKCAVYQVAARMNHVKPGKDLVKLELPTWPPWPWLSLLGSEP